MDVISICHPKSFVPNKKRFITEKAGLTSEEAAKFFPLYFELQDRKKQLNDEAWKLLRQGKEWKTTEAQYEEIMEGVYDARIASDRLDKTYFDKFKKILSCKKDLSGAKSWNAFPSWTAERHA